jgi:biopolymer transport protein ExbD
MNSSRRMKRMARANRNAVAGLSLTSLMDVFTILVLYLLVNQSTGTVLEPPPEIKLPNSVTETAPRETLVVSVSDDEVWVKDTRVASVQEILASEEDLIEPIRDRMMQIRASKLSLGAEETDQSKEVTIMGNRAIHFKVLKRVMTSCTAAGFTKISLAVNQK